MTQLLLLSNAISDDLDIILSVPSLVVDQNILNTAVSWISFVTATKRTCLRFKRLDRAQGEGNIFFQKTISARKILGGKVPNGLPRFTLAARELV